MYNVTRYTVFLNVETVEILLELIKRSLESGEDFSDAYLFTVRGEAQPIGFVKKVGPKLRLFFKKMNGQIKALTYNLRELTNDFSNREKFLPSVTSTQSLSTFSLAINKNINKVC